MSRGRSAIAVAAALALSACLLGHAAGRVPERERRFHSPRQIRIDDSLNIRGVLPDPQIDRLYVTTDRQLLAYDLGRQRVVRRIDAPGGAPTIALLPDPGAIVMAAGSSLHLVDVLAGGVVDSIEIGVNARLLFIDAARERGYALAGRDPARTTVVFDLSGRIIARHPLPASTPIVQGPDGHLLVRRGETTLIVDPLTWAAVGRWTAPHVRTYNSIFDPTSDRLISRTDDALVVIDSRTGTILARTRVRVPSMQLGYDPDTQTVLLSSRDPDDRANRDRGFVTVFRVEGDRIVRVQDFITSGVIASYRYDRRTGAFFGVTNWQLNQPIPNVTTSSNLPAVGRREWNGPARSALWMFEPAR